MTNNYKANERNHINQKIEDFALEEKQLKANIYRQQLDLSTKNDMIQSIEAFKKEIVSFKVNYEAMNQTDLRDWLRRNLDHVSYTKEEIQIEFKLLKPVG